MKDSGKLSLLIGYLLNWVLIAQLNLASSVYAQTVPELITIEELLSDPQLAHSYYDYLRARFKNDNFDEILFLDDPNSRGPRLSRENYEKMLKTLDSFLERHPEEAARFREVENIQPFRIQSNGQIELIPEKVEKEWRIIGNSLSNLAIKKEDFLINFDHESREKILLDISRTIKVEPSDVLKNLDFSNQSDQEAIIKSLVKQYNRKKDSTTLRLIADLLINFEASPVRLEKLRTWNLPGHIQYAVLEDIENGAVKMGRQLGVPGKLLDSLLSQSSLGQAFERSAFFRKGTTLVPMTRFEATFKGIGPGECVRTACNRYFDSIFDDSIHLKILKNGKETGFVGIYKTVDPKSGQKFWFIETIQSPFVMDPSTAPKIMRGLIRHLQQIAILDDSHLAIPSESFNSYNYKEVVAELHSIPEANSGHSVSANFRNSDRLEKIKKFESSDLSEFDQMIARQSGYQPNVLTNGYTFNDGKMVVISPLTEQPDWYLQRSHELLSGKKARPVDYSLKIEPYEKAQLLKELVHGITVKQFQFDTLQYLVNEGRVEQAAALREDIYEVIPKELQEVSFEKQYEYVLHRIENVQQSEELAQKLKDELFLKASNWQDYLKIIKLGDKAKGKFFAPFLLFTFNKFADQANPNELLDLYRENIRYMPNDQSDLDFTRKIGMRLETPEEFVALVKAAYGQDVSGKFGNDKMRNLYIAENWERFYPAEANWRRRLNFAENLLNRVNNKTDIQIRSRLFKKARNFKELNAFLKLSRLEGHLDDFEKILLSKILSDTMIDIIHRSTTEEIIHRNMDMKGLKRFLLEHDLNRIKDVMIGKVSSIDDYKSIMRVGKVSSTDLLKLLENDSISAEDKQRLIAIISENILDDSFFNFQGTDLKNALDGSSIKDLQTLYEQTKKSKLSDYLKWKRILREKKLLKVSDAKNLNQYIKVVMGLPHELQIKVLNRFKEGKSVSFAQSIPEHQSLADTIKSWAEMVDLQGEKNAYPILENKFLLKIDQKKSTANTFLKKYLSSITSCMRSMLNLGP